MTERYSVEILDLVLPSLQSPALVQDSKDATRAIQSCRLASKATGFKGLEEIARLNCSKVLVWHRSSLRLPSNWALFSDNLQHFADILGEVNRFDDQMPLILEQTHTHTRGREARANYKTG